MEKNLLKSQGIHLVQQNDNARLRDLRQRANRCVCRFCGNTLDLRRLTYAAYDEARIELYCEHCDRIEIGTEPEIYQAAQYFVDQLKFDHYPNLESTAHKRKMNICVICDILSWGFQNTGLLTPEGFGVTLKLSENLRGEALLISDTLLSNWEGECGNEQ